MSSTGIILSPLLFNIFLNDVTHLSLFGRLMFMYADDIVLMYSSLDMQEDLNKLNQWFTKNIGTDPNEIIYPKVNNTELELVKSFKYLGLIIDSELKWTDHILNLK
ncbi:hypothetical protein B566_EDAN016410 [Ephemera danica]|nr:hypothetical protein B566_EDAN016410 [Ephemera danica]